MTADTDDKLHITMVARSTISISQPIFATCRRGDEVVGMSGVELGSVRNGLERFKEHCESARLARGAAVEYHCSVARQTARVVRPFRHHMDDVVLKTG